MLQITIRKTCGLCLIPSTIHRKLKSKTSFKRKESEKFEKKHSFHELNRHEKSGDVRKQDKVKYN